MPLHALRSAPPSSYQFKRHPLVRRILPKLARVARAHWRPSEKGFLEVVLMSTNDQGDCMLKPATIAARIGRRDQEQPDGSLRGQGDYHVKSMRRAADFLHAQGLLDWTRLKPNDTWPSGRACPEGGTVWHPKLEAIFRFLEGLTIERQKAGKARQVPSRAPRSRPAQAAGRRDSGVPGGLDIHVPSSELAPLPSEGSQSLPEGRLAPPTAAGVRCAHHEASETPGEGGAGGPLALEGELTAAREQPPPRGRPEEREKTRPGIEEHAPGQARVIRPRVWGDRWGEAPARPEDVAGLLERAGLLPASAGGPYHRKEGEDES